MKQENFGKKDPAQGGKNQPQRDNAQRPGQPFQGGLNNPKQPTSVNKQKDKWGGDNTRDKNK